MQSERTTNQYIPENIAANHARGGKRIDRPLSIRIASPSALVGQLDPNGNFNTVKIGPPGPSAMPDVVQRQLNNDMKNLIQDKNGNRNQQHLMT